MKKPLFKIIIITLIFTHLFTICFKDAGFAVAAAVAQKTTSKVTKEELIGYDKKSYSQSQIQSSKIMTLSASSADSFSPEKAIKSFYLDPFTGTASLSLPLFAPPGRKGVQPNLNLTYSSRNANGPLGWGWRIDFGGYIERSAKNGIPKYDSTDTFICFLNGASYELVSLGNNEYRSKNENNFLKFKFNGTSWIVIDKEGNTYYFGRNKFTLGYKESLDWNTDPSNIFRWYLDGVKDGSGNTLFGYVYYYSGVEPLPCKFFYTYYQPNSNEYEGGADKKGLIEVSFWPLEGTGTVRRDTIDNFRSGSRQVELEGYRWLKEIDVKYIPVDGTAPVSIRKYNFEYAYSKRTYLSHLSKITEVASDGAEMPPIIFNYQDSIQPTYQVLSLTGDPTTGDNLWNIRVGDDPYTIHYRTINNYALFPWSSNYWGPIFTQVSGSDIGLNWNINSNGDLAINSAGWREFYAWTYVYVQSGRTLNLSCSGNSNHTVYLNADYNNYYRGASIPLSLKPGYNLIEVTGYNENNFSFSLSANMAGNTELMNSQQVIVPSLSGDFNGDGLDDVGTFFSSAGTCKISLSNGNSFLPKQAWIDNFGINQKLLLGDFNGDGKTDICAFDSINGNWKVALSDGTKFVDDGIWIYDFGKNSQPITGDFNGDGKIDIGIVYNAGTQFYYQIALGRQKNFEKQPPFSTYSYGGDTPIVTDLNNDGLTDLGYFSSTKGYWQIWLNSINGFIYYSMTVTNFGANNIPLVLDFNGDGLSDIGYYDYSSGKFKVKLYDGSYLNDIPTTEWPFIFTLRDTNIQVQTMDYNGDGIQDFCAYDSLGHSEIALSKGDIPDLLSKVENGTGGTLELKYIPYSKFNDSSGNLPFILPVLSESIVSDGQGNSYKTTYAYSGGIYDTEDKEFRGFGYTRVVDAEGNATESYFKQDDIYKGKLYKQEVRDKDANLYSKTENIWQYAQPYAGTYFPFLAQADIYIYDGDATYKQTRTRFEYDAYGNTVKASSEGDVELAGDEKTQITEYTYNIADWLVAYPKHTYLLDANQSKVSERWFYYDNHTNLDDLPAKGLLTKTESWLYNPITQTEERLSNAYSYDEYGNLISTTDALGRITTTTYDAELHTYPATTANALGHTIRTTYDPKLGQLLEAIDPNNQKTTKVYDSLGRLIKIIGPQDTTDFPGVIYEYDLVSKPIKTTKKVKINYATIPDYLTYYSFYDGLSRLIQTKSPAQDNLQTGQARQVVSGIVSFDQRGQIKEKYLPYFTDSSADYVAPSYDTPHTAFSYDALGRLIQTTNADLTYSSINYSDWMRNITDENGHYKTQYYDAYGRTVKIEEHDGSQIYTTSYEYDALGNLTKVIDNQGNITQIRYDSLARKIGMDDPDMGVWAYEYDKVGNLKKQTDAKGQSLEFTYDSLNRLSAKRYPLSANPIAEYFYDDTSKSNCIGRFSKVTDQSGSADFFYDNLGREIKSIKTVNAASYTVERAYDALDRLVTLKYPDNSIIKYEYNPHGIKKISDITNLASPLDYVTNIDYSLTNQITKIQYGNGTETSYSYDPNTLRLNSLTSQSPFGKIQDLNYQFDNVGNIKNITDYVNTATQSFLYDDLNRLAQAQGSYGSFTYDYDSIGNMLYKEGVSLIYGKQGKLPHAVTQYGSTLIDYDANGNMIKKGKVDLTYDIENRLIRAEDKSVTEPVTLTLSLKPGWNFFSLPVIPPDPKISSVLSSIQGKYDQVSRYNSTAKKLEHYAGNSKYDQFNAFEYGRGYQIYVTGSSEVNLILSGTLPSVSQAVQLKAGYNLIFTPNIAEIPVESALSPLRIGVDYSKVLYYNKSLNKFQEYSNGKKEFTALTPGAAYYLYCLSGLTWNINSSDSITVFTYDGDGGRVKKALSSGVSTTYIGSLFEKDSSGKATKHIFAGPNRICAVESTGNKYFYHSDHLGSSNVLTDAAGNQAGLTEFKPYGSLSKQAGTYNPKFKFTGKELDSTGFYFYGARYYDHQLGRFITADTIIQAPFDPQSLNRYSYCRNNPLVYVDPTGHSFWSAAGSFFSGFGSFFSGTFSAIGGFFSGFFGGAFGRGGGSNSGGSSGGSFSALPSPSRQGSGSDTSKDSWYGTGRGLGKGLLALGLVALAIASAPAALTGSAAFQLGTGILGIAGSAGVGLAGGAAITGRSITGQELTPEQRGEAAGYSIVGVVALGVGAMKTYGQTESSSVYRQGTFANVQWKGNFIRGTKWAPEHPLTTPNFAQKYGLPFENSGKPDWVVGGRVNGVYKTGSAPASYNNPSNTGGATEIIPDNPADVTLDWFHMPD